jgi:hypothetical protein
MRIAVDARPLSGPQTGIARYTLNLLRHMIPMGHQWFLYSDKPLQVDLGELVEDCSVQVRCGDVRPKSAGSVVASQWQFNIIYHCSFPVILPAWLRFMTWYGVAFLKP